ncbi:MAG: winged helix-turn-helix domain-containing protein [Muribaculaceae bacterium]|nr:winged helix-turn-helix domain-containing protein [Muribaculaceae bacterium]
MVTLVIRFKNSITPHRKGDDPVNDPINDPVNEPVNDVLKDILEFIKSNPGIKKTAIITHVGKSKATLTRYLKQLVNKNLIEYKGSDKTGGYYLKK